MTYFGSPWSSISSNIYIVQSSILCRENLLRSFLHLKIWWSILTLVTMIAPFRNLVAVWWIEVVEEVGLDPSRDGIDPLLDRSSNKRFSFFTWCVLDKWWYTIFHTLTTKHLLPYRPHFLIRRRILSRSITSPGTVTWKCGLSPFCPHSYRYVDMVHTNRNHLRLLFPWNSSH